MANRIAMIGGGNMATALVGGLIKNGFDPATIDVLDRNEHKRKMFAEEMKVVVHDAPGEWLKEATVVVLAVKPQGLAQTCETILPFLAPNALMFSIAAGVRIGTIARWTKTDKVVRTMPNTPSLVGAGVIGFFAPAGLDEEALALSKQVAEAMDEVIEVRSEQELDLLSTVSGSGPAYVFRFIEALEAAAIKRGFDPEGARRMAIMTLWGASKLAMESTEPPAKLRENVTSKKGTTAEALRVMQEHDFMGMMDEAIQAAYDRNQVLATELDAAA
ncbi:MAG: pyrroline-5-carboxylate reductase [Burkholderiaceae bacterium]|nr:pyrroline-5-carboxylate reductase [Burkholderiaceae bacterium]